jgi:hypothetical protein
MGFVTWWPRLREHQLRVLRRIADGVDPVTSREPALAKTVYALRSRRLVTTPRSGGVWTAVITDAGRFYLDHGRYQGGPVIARTPAGRAVGVTGGTRGRGAAGPLERAWTVPPPRELVKRLTDGSRVRVESPSAPVRAAWRGTVRAAERERLVPAGRRIRYTVRDRGDLVIELVPAGVSGGGGSADGKSQRAGVMVPAVVDESVPVVAMLRGQTEEGFDVSAASRPRALRLVQALAGEAERHGHSIGAGADSGQGFWVEVDGHRYRLIMGEEWDTVEYVPGLDESHGGRVYDWQRVKPQTRRVRSGRLFLELVDDSFRHRGRPRRWADRKRWRLADKLGEALAELEARAQLDEQARQAAEQARLERAARWEQAMRVARHQYFEQQRVRALEKQLDRRDRAQKVRAYAAELTAVGEAGHDRGLLEWIAWLEAYADRIDPLLPHPVAPAEPPEPGPEDLRPYLNGLSPYGPDR